MDRDRTRIPISGTKIRSDPFTFWEYLEAPVRAWFAVRICVVGAESTGKTTLAQALAAHYQTKWVAEYGREYSERRRKDGDVSWTPVEFLHIASTQCERENAQARHANRVLVCDTDAFATGIWYQRYFHARSPEIEAIYLQQKPANLYLLTDVNTPYEQDDIRDGEAIRSWMHQTFVAELTLARKPFEHLAGEPAVRLSFAIKKIEELLGRG